MAIEFEVSEGFRASPEEVFDALVDLEAWSEWMPGLVHMERLSPKPLQVGSEWRESREMFGRKGTEHFKVIGLDRPHRLELQVDGAKGSSGRGQYRFQYRITPIEGGSAVVLQGEIRGLSGLVAILGKVLVGSYKKACANDLRALKNHLEGGQEARHEEEPAG